MAPMAHDRKWRILKMGSHRPYLSLYFLALLSQSRPPAQMTGFSTLWNLTFFDQRSRGRFDHKAAVS